MSGLISALLHATNYKNPFLRTLIPSIGLAFGLQAATALPSIIGQTERYYDLSGSLTYISCTALSLYLPTLRARYAASLTATQPAWPSLLASFSSKAGVNAWNWRQVVLSAAVTFWAARLGTFLFSRITAENGKDSRFDSITFEATADRQKSQWMKEKTEKKHSEDFLTRGLWSKSRHPNYFGESTLWTGIATTAAGVMMSNIGQASMGFSGSAGGRIAALAMAGVSPAFVSFLLLKVSGVPMSEKKYDKRYGDRKDYQKWKEETPMFIPKF
ncbi:hypothetical protein LTS02_003234 [Friedmanniomyces endolithicus]|nr:hypothetical protein LTS02_003234 [Friedmanniomyces endolithicus]